MTIATAEPIDTELQPPDMVWVAGRSFVMGSDNHYPEEGPAHEVSVDGFWIDPTPVRTRSSSVSSRRQVT